jgi:hypothetical protein
MRGISGSTMPKRKSNPTGSVDLECDLDVDSLLTRRGKEFTASAPGGSWFPHGPKDLAGLLHWEPELVGHALSTLASLGYPQTIDALRNLVSGTIVATTSYSGLGTAEIALSRVLRELRTFFGMSHDKPFSFIVYSVSDSDAACLDILERHPDAFRARHRFGNILDRLYDVDRTYLEDILNAKLAQFDILKEEKEIHALTHAQFKVEVDCLGRELVRILRAKLDVIEFRLSTWCLACKAYCPISPRYDQSSEFSLLRKALWIEVAGPVCCPWSNMGAHGGWLDRSTLVALVWAYSTRYFEPDQVYKENVRHVDDSLFNNIFTSSEVLKSPRARSCDMLATYSDVKSHMFSPSHLGHPSERHRMYARWDLSPFVVQDCEAGFQDMFYKMLATDLSVYLVADAEVVQYEVGEEVKKSRDACRGRSSSSLQGPHNPLDLLLGSEQNRVEGFVFEAMRQKLCNSEARSWASTAVIANVSQESDFINQLCSEKFPALLRSSRFVNLATSQPVTTLETWLVQCFPHPFVQGLPPHVAESFPCLGRVAWRVREAVDVQETLPLKTQRQLVGNSMHSVQVAAWVLYGLAVTSRSFDSLRPGSDISGASQNGLMLTMLNAVSRIPHIFIERPRYHHCHQRRLLHSYCRIVTLLFTSYYRSPSSALLFPTPASFKTSPLLFQAWFMSDCFGSVYVRLLLIGDCFPLLAQFLSRIALALTSCFLACFCCACACCLL